MGSRNHVGAIGNDRRFRETLQKTVGSHKWIPNGEGAFDRPQIMRSWAREKEPQGNDRRFGWLLGRIGRGNREVFCDKGVDSRLSSLWEFPG